MPAIPKKRKKNKIDPIAFLEALQEEQYKQRCQAAGEIPYESTLIERPRKEDLYSRIRDSGTDQGPKDSQWWELSQPENLIKRQRKKDKKLSGGSS